MNSEQRGASPADGVRLVVESQDALLAHVADLTNEQARQPSLLPTWTVGHVLTHIARNADGFARMGAGAARGEIVAMYEHGMEGRAADIEAGADRDAAELVADVRTSSARLIDILATLDDDAWAGAGLTVTGPTPMAEVPSRRRREVEIHRIDLGLGYTFADLPPGYVRAELATMTGQWASRKPMGFSDLPAAALALSPPDRLAWLFGRLDVEGLPPAGIY